MRARDRRQVPFSPPVPSRTSVRLLLQVPHRVETVRRTDEDPDGLGHPTPTPLSERDRQAAGAPVRGPGQGAALDVAAHRGGQQRQSLSPEGRGDGTLRTRSHQL
jgi:hypothetical protein